MTGTNAAVTYYSVFDEVSKQSLQLNFVERMWAVCDGPFCVVTVYVFFKHDEP